MKENETSREELIEKIKGLRAQIEELKKSEGEWLAIIENAPDYIIKIDRDGSILYLNRAIAGSSIEESRDKTVYDYIVPKYHDATRKAINRVFETGKISQVEVDMQLPRGDVIYFLNRYGPIRRDGNIVAVVQASTDITERRKAYDRIMCEVAGELRKSKERLEQATAQLVQSEKLTALGELAAGVAHELNQPLNVIKIVCQSVLKDIERGQFSKEELGKDLPEIVNQTNKMAAIIEHMRIFTRSGEGTIEEMFDLSALVENSFKFIGQQLKNHSIEVIKELEPDLPKVSGNSVNIEQVFLNLVSNARYALEGSMADIKRIEIRTSKSEDNKFVVLEIKDNGKGIPEDEKDKIFQPFFTSKEALPPDGEPVKGKGLGLAVSNRIVQEHKGHIELSSELGKGTTFRVALPVA